MRKLYSIVLVSFFLSFIYFSCKRETLVDSENKQAKEAQNWFARYTTENTINQVFKKATFH